MFAAGVCGAGEATTGGAATLGAVVFGVVTTGAATVGAKGMAGATAGGAEGCAVVGGTVPCAHAQCANAADIRSVTARIVGARKRRRHQSAGLRLEGWTWALLCILFFPLFAAPGAIPVSRASHARASARKSDPLCFQCDIPFGLEPRPRRRNPHFYFGINKNYCLFSMLCSIWRHGQALTLSAEDNCLRRRVTKRRALTGVGEAQSAMDAGRATQPPFPSVPVLPAVVTTRATSISLLYLARHAAASLLLIVTRCSVGELHQAIGSR